MNATELIAADIVRAYREDILLFAKVELGFIPDGWQKKALIAYAKKDPKILRIAMSCCVGPGKSALLAVMTLWFLLTQGEQGAHPKGVAVAISGDNLRDNLAAEISKWMGNSELLSSLFVQNRDRIASVHHPKTWFLSFRTFRDRANPEELGRTLSGVHGKYLLFVVDESGAIHPAMLRSAEQALSTVDIEFARFVQAGNPVDLGGMLHHAVRKEADKWHIINISGDPDDPDRSSRVSREWAETQIKLYGREHDWVRGHVLGQFPKNAINTLLSWEEVEEASRRHYVPEQYDHSQKRLGVDVAGSGMDFNILFPRQGLVAFNYVSVAQATGRQIADRILDAQKRWGVDQIFLDGTGGWGYSAHDALIASGGYAHMIGFAEKGGAGFLNRRAQMWWDMALWIKRGGCIPKCDQLHRELAELTYTYRGDALMMEAKDQLKIRLGYSPDRADALALTFALPELSTQSSILDRVADDRQTRDWNPLS